MSLGLLQLENEGVFERNNLNSVAASFATDLSYMADLLSRLVPKNAVPPLAGLRTPVQCLFPLPTGLAAKALRRLLKMPESIPVHPCCIEPPLSHDTNRAGDIQSTCATRSFDDGFGCYRPTVKDL